MPCEVKLFEVRDRSTFMPMMAIRLGAESPAERYLLRRAGYDWNQIDNPDGALRPYVILCTLDGVEAHVDPFAWQTCARTLPTAHHLIRKLWNDLTSGDVVDVQFILGETSTPTVSEAVSYGL